MPVTDHPVHEHGVRETSTHRYGCHNRRDRFKSYHIAQDGWWNDGHELIAKVKAVEFRMSNECRYDKSLKDSRCQGCRHQGSVR